MNPEEANASLGTQRFAAALSRDWIVDAHDQLSAATRSVAASSVELKIGDWSGTIASESDQAALEASLAASIDKKTDEALSAIKFRGGPLFAAICVVPAAALIAASAPFGIIAMLVCAFIAIRGYMSLEPRRKAAREAGEASKRQSAEALRTTIADYVDYVNDWRKHDVVAEELHGFLSGLSVSDHILTRPESARAVMV